MVESNGSRGSAAGARAREDMERLEEEACSTTLTNLDWVNWKLGHVQALRISLLPSPPNFYSLGAQQMVMWKYHVVAGLCFPLNAYIRRIYELFRVPVSQIFRSSFRRAIAFHIVTTVNGGQPLESANLFFHTYIRKYSKGFYLFQAHPGVKINFLGEVAQDKGYRGKYLMVSVGDGRIESNLGVAQHELHKSPSDLGKGEEVRTFSPGLLAYI